MKYRTLMLAATLGGFMAFTATPVQASLVGITSEGSLGTVNTFDWSQLGPPGTELSGPQNVTTTTGGATGTISSSGGDTFAVLQQSTSFLGNFAPGTNVLWNNYGARDIEMSLTYPVSGIGAQVQWIGAQPQSSCCTVQYASGTFTVEAIAYDKINNIIGTFSENGVSNFANDGSAIFIGMQDSVSDIYKLQFLITESSSNTNGLGIGPVSIAGTYAAPLPAGLPMFVFALLSVFGVVQLKKQNKYT